MLSTATDPANITALSIAYSALIKLNNEGYANLKLSLTHIQTLTTTSQMINNVDGLKIYAERAYVQAAESGDWPAIRSEYKKSTFRQLRC
jgi:hypothetical protein